MSSIDRLANRWLEARLTTTNFWAIVQSLGWGRSYDYKAMKADLISRLDEQQAKEFRGHFSRLKDALKKKLNDWEQDTGEDLGVGDDGFDDLTSHIIGLGKREYDAVMRDPAKGAARASARYGSPDGYKESFAYAIPYESDYRRSAPAQEPTQEIDRPINADDMPSGLVSAYKKALGDVASALTKQKAADEAVKAAIQQGLARSQNVVEWAVKTYGHDAARDWLGRSLRFGDSVGPWNTRGKSHAEIMEMWDEEVERVLRALG